METPFSDRVPLFKEGHWLLLTTVEKAIDFVHSLPDGTRCTSRWHDVEMLLFVADATGTSADIHAARVSLVAAADEEGWLYHNPPKT